MSTLQADLEFAKEAARAAGKAVFRFFRLPAEVRYKSPDQPVTEADLIANRILREALQGARPRYGWLSEESADSPARLGADRVWIVDPIDGTRSFLSGYEEFAVSIGLTDRGKPRLGVVYNPATDELYHALAGGGAFLDGRPITVSTTSAGGSILASRTEMRRGELEPFRSAWDVEPLGSTAYKMVRVADGRGDAFLSRGQKSEWDVCAADLIVVEAGGRVTDARGAAIRYNRNPPLLQGILASNGFLHSSLLDHLSRLPSASRLRGIEGKDDP